MDYKVEEFTNTVNNIIDSYFPEKTVRLHCENRFFMTGKIKGLLKKRDLGIDCMVKIKHQ